MPHTEDHITTEENKPSEQLPKSNGTVENHISRPSKFTARWNTYFYLRFLIEKRLVLLPWRFKQVHSAAFLKGKRYFLFKERMRKRE